MHLLSRKGLRRAVRDAAVTPHGAASHQGLRRAVHDVEPRAHVERDARMSSLAQVFLYSLFCVTLELSDTNVYEP